MTLPDAHETARNAATRFGKPFRVYRLPAWPVAVYGATSVDLPAEAQVVATYPKFEVRTQKVDAAPAAADAQGSLF